MKQPKIIFLVALVVLAWGRTHIAQAQDKPFGIRLGVSRLSDGDTNDAFGIGEHVGLSYQFAQKGRVTPQVELNYSHFSDGSDRFNTLGLAANAQIALGNRSDGLGPYGIVGFGIFRVGVKASGTNGGGGGGGNGGGGNGGGGNGGGGGVIPPPIVDPPIVNPPINQEILGSVSAASFNPGINGVDDSSIKLGSKFGLGYKFNKMLSTEVAYTVLGKVKGASANRLELSVGINF